MSRFTDDRLLWLIVGVGLLAAYRIIPATLEHIRSLTEVHEKHGAEEGQKFNRESELALKPETLRVLADGPSYELRVSAIKIVATRCLNDDHARNILLRDLTSKEPQTRDKALNALSLLLFHRALLTDKESIAAEAFSDEAGFKAVVDALINCLPLHEDEKEFTTVQKDAGESEKPHAGRAQKEHSSYPLGSPIRPPRRPAQETSLMEILFEHLSVANRNKPTLSASLSAGLITRWLNIYPFPCASPLNAHRGFRRSDVVSLLRADAWASDDPLMARIMHVLTRDADALKQLRTCGLRASNYTEALRSGCGNTFSSQDQDQDQDVLMTNSEDTAGVSARPGSSWARQAPSRSHEEESLRRRHREAIVVADRGTPFSRDNILQRQNSRVGPTPLSTHDLPSPRSSDNPAFRADLLSRMASNTSAQSSSGPAQLTVAIPPADSLTELVQISETDMPHARRLRAGMDTNTQMTLVMEASARDHVGIEVEGAEVALARPSADRDPAGEAQDMSPTPGGAGR